MSKHSKAQGNGAQASLYSRIAAALSVDNPTRDELVTLVREATEALAAAEETVRVETECAEDIENLDPEASELRIIRAKRIMARLQKAIPRLRERVQQIDTAEYAMAWHQQVDQLELERNKLAKQLLETYVPVLQNLIDLFGQIDINATAIDELHARAPAGERRRLLDAELVARGLDSYEVAHPPLRTNLRLPEFYNSTNIIYGPVDWTQMAALNAASLTTALANKFALAASADWHKAEELRQEQLKKEVAERETVLRKKAEQKKQEFYKALREEDRKARLGVR